MSRRARMKLTYDVDERYPFFTLDDDEGYGYEFVTSWFNAWRLRRRYRAGERAQEMLDDINERRLYAERATPPPPPMPTRPDPGLTEKKGELPPPPRG